MLGSSFADKSLAQFVKIYDFTLSNDINSPLYTQPVTDGTYLYGMSKLGGVNGLGNVFKVKTDGSSYATLLSFSGTANGSSPDGSLILSGTILYGMTYDGGANNLGCIFKINTDGTGYSKLFDFSGTADGANPQGSLILSGTILYGMTYAGGANNLGSIFKYDLSGAGYTRLFSFSGSADGSNPYGDLILSGTILYGMTYAGGSVSGLGCIFKYDLSGTGYTKMYSFTASAYHPYGSLILSAGILYGLANNFGVGTIFQYDIGSSTFSILHTLGGTNPESPTGSLVLSGTTLYGMGSTGGVNSRGGIFKYDLSGGGYSSVYDFNGVSDGKNPGGTLLLSGGVLYGLTNSGGYGVGHSLLGSGIFFKINTDGSGYTKILDCNYAPNGVNPCGIIFSSDVIYGMTPSGGAYNNGTIYKINYDGTSFTKLLDFNTTNGADPERPLIISGNVLYGSTYTGGASNKGCIFKLNTDGSGYSKILDFTGGAVGQNGTGSSGLIIYKSTLFGVTPSGGAYGNGTVYKIRTDGSGYADLYDLGQTATDPSYAKGELALSGNMLYGTGGLGGANGGGCIFKVDTSGGSYTKIYDFAAAGGGYPQYQPLIISGSTLYGATDVWGSSNMGTAYKINTDGSSFQVLVDFNGTNGGPQDGGLTISGSNVYGLTYLGGVNNLGLLYSVKTDGTGYADLLDFNGTLMGSNAYQVSPLLTIRGLFGTTYKGGVNNMGTIFKNSVLLPIELISFDAKCNNGKVFTAWETATETNNEYFTLEKSRDGINFQNVTTVKGAGNSSRKLSYNSTDNESYSGISYYRLKQTDFDGKYTYSKVVSVGVDVPVFALSKRYNLRLSVP